MTSKLRRIKEVTMDGATVRIAPLTLDQIEEYVAPLEEIALERTAKIRAYDLVCHGLNNALVDGEELWTQELLRKDIDLLFFERLQREILEFSGFKLDTNKPVEKQAVAVPGELSAASDAGNSRDEAESSPVSTSATSAAA